MDQLPFRADVREYTHGDDLDDEADFATLEEAERWVHRQKLGRGSVTRVWINNIEMPWRGDQMEEWRQKVIATVIAKEMHNAGYQSEVIQPEDDICTAAMKLSQMKAESRDLGKELVEMFDDMFGKRPVITNPATPGFGEAKK